VTELGRWKGDRVIELYNKLWAVVAERKGISLDEALTTHEVRQIWSEDFDRGAEMYYQLVWDSQLEPLDFSMTPITKFEIVGFYGWHQGNVRPGAIEYLKVFIENTKIREYPGIFLDSELNDIFIFPDPFYAFKTQRLSIVPHLRQPGPAGYVRCFPLGFAIKAR